MLNSKFSSSLAPRRYIGGKLGARVLSLIDHFIPAALNAEVPETLRRYRLLVACSFGLALFALPFFVLDYVMEGYLSPTTWSFISGCTLLILNPFLLRWTKSSVLPGVLFSLNLILHFAFMTYANGGYNSAVIIWNPIIPLLSTLLVGPTLGLVCTGLVAAETFLFYLLTQSGYPFPQPLTEEQIRLFRMFGSVTVIVFVGFLAWLYEQLRKSAMDLVEKSNTALRQSEVYFRSLIENTSDFIALLDHQGMIRYANPAHKQGLGYALEELLGKSAFTFVHPEDRTAIVSAFGDHLRTPGVSPRTEVRFRHKDGSWRVLEVGADNLLHDPAVNGMIVNSRDITERKAVERLKDELVSTVSHELRTPLTSLRGFTELMLKKEFTPAKQREFLTIIHNESVRLTNLINDFLDLQRMETGAQVYEFTAVHLSVLLHETVTTFFLENSQHRAQLQCGDALPLVRADTDRLRQVLANLLSNAIKFSPRGGTVTVGARVRDHAVEVWVADQGVGIPAEALPHLFTKFFRVDNRDTRSIGGTGLGLALVKQIIEAHGGRIWVESAMGQGSTFFFSLPLAAAPLVSQPALAPEPAPQDASSQEALV